MTDAESGCLKDAGEVSAIGFKAVHGGAVSGVERVTPAVLDAMDVLGGAALCRGPRNPLMMALEGSSIQITVEGANILTRSLIILVLL